MKDNKHRHRWMAKKFECFNTVDVANTVTFKSHCLCGAKRIETKAYNHYGVLDNIRSEIEIYRNGYRVYYRPFNQARKGQGGSNCL